MLASISPWDFMVWRRFYRMSNDIPSVSPAGAIERNYLAIPALIVWLRLGGSCALGTPHAAIDEHHWYSDDPDQRREPFGHFADSSSAERRVFVSAFVVDRRRGDLTVRFVVVCFRHA